MKTHQWFGKNGSGFEFESSPDIVKEALEHWDLLIENCKKTYSNARSSSVA